MLLHLKETLRLAIPVIIGQLGQMMMGVVDSIMVGRLGAAPLAAASLGNGLFLIILLFGTGITLAVSPLVSHSTGQGKPENGARILVQGVYVALFAGFLLSITAVWGSSLIGVMGQEHQVEQLAIGYSKTLGWSVTPFLIFMTFKQFFEGLHVMVPGMIVSILANVINVFFNWVFIYGNLGAPALGLEGAGWATLGTRIGMAVAMVVYLFAKSDFRAFLPHLKALAIERKMMLLLLKLGVPSGIQYFFEVSAFVASAFMIGWIGKSELAAHQIAINLASISYMVSLGISMSSSVRVGKYLGEKDWVGLRKAGMAAFILILCFMLCSGILLTLGNAWLPTLYIRDEKVIVIASQLILLAALFQLSDGQQAVCLGVLRGIQDVSVPARLTFVAYWVFGIPFGWVLARYMGFGVRGIWLGLVLGLTLSAGFLTLRFFRFTKREIDNDIVDFSGA